MPDWKQDADCLFVQVSFSVEELLEWRATVTFEGPVYAGVIVLASASMAAKLSTNIPELSVPEAITDRLSRDPHAGVEIACETVDAVRHSGVFEGVHLVPVGRYREVSARLEQVG